MRNLWLLPLLALAACATSASLPSVSIIGGGTWAFADRAAALRSGMAEGAPLVGERLDSTPSTSLHVLVIRDREPYHVHEKSDVTALVVEGEGYLETEAAQLPVKAGDVVVIPRGAPHAYVNTARGGSTLYASFSPPFVDGDRLPVAR